ncbi:hypothetical protein N9C22_06300, partial [Paracoccaceae bacterium]|nr:hypothetical protein [Paracoccaceae bacterium]
RPDQMLTYSIHIERAFEGLIELGYLEVTKPGYFDRSGRKDGTPTSRLSRYIATDKLFTCFSGDELDASPAMVPQYHDPELVRVRVKEVDEAGVNRKHSVKVIETPETIQMVENLKIINRALSLNWYDLQIPDDELVELQKRLADDPVNERLIRMDRRSLHRIFNDSDLKTGGRFYGGWWQNIPKEYRKHLIVNGKQMVELDYSNQHPSILYAQEGVARPVDCYSLGTELLKLSSDHCLVGFRNTVKAAFNAMLNSPRTLKRAPTGVDLSKFGLKWAELSSAIMDFHEPIAHHFYTAVGLKLQRLDSNIAEKVLLYFASQGIAILPLHDSFLMHDGRKDSLESVMRDAFIEVVGLPPKIDHKSAAKRTKIDTTELGQPTTLCLNEILDNKAGHCLRLDTFRMLRRSNLKCQ